MSRYTRTVADDDLKAAVQRLDGDVKTLSGDVKTLQIDSAKHGEMLTQLQASVADNTETLAHVADQLGKAMLVMQQLNGSVTTFASAVTQAVTQMATTQTTVQSHERRLERLEAAVFPPKH